MILVVVKGKFSLLHPSLCFLTLPVRRGGVGMTSSTVYEDNSAPNEPKLAKFLLIQVR